jgi:hypothetical protein
MAAGGRLPHRNPVMTAQIRIAKKTASRISPIAMPGREDGPAATVSVSRLLSVS